MRVSEERLAELYNNGIAVEGTFEERTDIVLDLRDARAALASTPAASLAAQNEALREALGALYDYAHEHTALSEFEGGPPTRLLAAQNVLSITPAASLAEHDEKVLAIVRAAEKVDGDGPKKDWASGEPLTSDQADSLNKLRAALDARRRKP